MPLFENTVLVRQNLTYLKDLIPLCKKVELLVNGSFTTVCPPTRLLAELNLIENEINAPLDVVFPREKYRDAFLYFVDELAVKVHLRYHVRE